MSSQAPVIRYIVLPPTDEVLFEYLSKLDGVQIARLCMSLKSPVAQAMFTNTLFRLGLPAAAPAAAPAAGPVKAKKALNAFVGYRCYYIHIADFKPWPMKMLSGPMSVMWEGDPNKSSWSLMTKAWSTVRDQIGKEQAPLDTFLNIICPYLNIPAPETYLARFGWEVATNDKGAPVVSRKSIPMPESIGAGVAATTVSVEDIIRLCQSIGYAQAFAFDKNLPATTVLGQSLRAYSATDPIHEERVAMRNQRRAMRQHRRETAVAPVAPDYDAFFNAPAVNFNSNPWNAFRTGANENATLLSYDE
ncbi:hypothetical protein EJ04DRAFT_57976 [Polyplosphaeria fusca]|uniref:Mating-type protein MAT-1 n=1 Tax=Polyplosphaeria fusca TaxID=682080 RepID=A0A9P4QP55_9PLEO|nr:hypothetical protein EJ04DRAFT_57976 [Polyplosphaeria fusca]